MAEARVPDVGNVTNVTNVTTVTLLVRRTCGSCERVRRQIAPVCEEHGAVLEVIDVDASDAGTSLAVEFGDRVPVVLVDEEEVACWEIDDEELVDAIGAARS